MSEPPAPIVAKWAALAALVMLRLVDIHPFDDGNGRTSRGC